MPHKPTVPQPAKAIHFAGPALKRKERLRLSALIKEKPKGEVYWASLWGRALKHALMRLMTIFGVYVTVIFDLP